jgi:glycosyltransferase involved in cell wall biosynthesis
MQQLDGLEIGPSPGFRFERRTIVHADRPRTGAHHKSIAASISATPQLAILLCTYQGERFLADQLESIAEQSYADWKIWASDDGSQDRTLAILDSYKGKWGKSKISVCSGPKKGFAANFLSLVCSESIVADYYAYSDQDDIWDKDKLQRALDWLASVPKNVPALYCSRTQLVDEENNPIGFSPLFTKPPSFANALMQNVGGGNTMVFNNAARRLLQKAGTDIEVVTHDWWTYMVVSACGGQVHYDTRPSLRYRQHESNLVGKGTTWCSRLLRLRKLWEGRLQDWNARNIRAINQLRPWMTDQNRATLDHFSSARNQSLLPRMIGFARAGVYRQTLVSNLVLIAAIIFKKL